MNNAVPSQIAKRKRSGNIGFSALTAVLIAAMPKCPICWMALTSTLGVGSTINSQWMQPLAVALLLLSVSALLLSARRRNGYVPFILGLVAAIVMYLCKFRLNYDPGVYLSGAVLLGASIWNALLPKRQAEDNMECHC